MSRIAARGLIVSVALLLGACGGGGGPSPHPGGDAGTGHDGGSPGGEDGGVDAGLKCEGGTVECAGACRDLQTDSANCGECGQPCDLGSVCVSGTCQATCGNGALDEGEGCDDANTAPGDGCSSACAVEEGYTCSGSPSVCATKCGDGIVAGSEACDDGNTQFGDGCSKSCQVEPGYACTGTPSVCAPVCGDGAITGTETCDDGNTAAGDGCSDTCTLEAGWLCDSEPSVCQTLCGDGIVAGTETCDDHNAAAGDGCSSACQTEPGYQCVGVPSTCTTTCGDGVAAGIEQCDDGNLSDADGCDHACLVEDGYTCTGTPSVCATTCGDGLIGGSEACDDFNTTPGDGCSETCAVEAGFQCTGTPSLCATTCGDGVPAGTETCDDGNTSPNDGCSASCAAEPGYTCTGTPSVCATTCGDGMVGGAEACDDFNTNSGDGCSAQCAVEAGFTCTQTSPSQCSAICGDGVIAGFETCDDANTVAGDGCDATCTTELGYTCTGQPSACAAVCGDGIQTVTEACDDGNTTGGDCCSSACALESGCELEPNNTDATANAWSAVSVSGEVKGFISPTSDLDVYSLNLATWATLTAETLDGPLGSLCASNEVDTYLTLRDSTGAELASNDDNDVNWCSILDSIALAPGQYYVEVKNSPYAGPIDDYTLRITLQVPVCGNGAVEAGETCDDGNTTAGDGCSATCAWELTPETEANDTAATANTVSLGHLVSASIGTVGDVDWFKFTLAATSDLTIETFDGNGPPTCDLVDTAVDLIASDGVTVLGSDNDNGLNLCSKLEAGVNAAATHVPAGTYYVRVTQNGSTATIGSYRLIVKQTAVCGDSVIQGSEECDGTANCTTTCDRVVTCGDGYVDGTETCDDGNTLAGDGCNATCAVEATAEIEPNGTSADADTNASGTTPLVISGSAFLSGAISSIGDQDMYKVTVASDTAIRFETFGPTVGDCPVGLGLTLRIYDSTGTNELYADPSSGIGQCSAIVAYLAAGTYYVRVEESNNDATVASYLLQAAFETDAGNEIEPNDAQATATGITSSDVYVFGGHQTGTDEDWYSITVPAGKSVRAEVIEGGTETCEGQDVDSRLQLYDSSGTLLVDNDDGGRGFCSAIDGTGALYADQAAHNLNAGTYYLKVSASQWASGTTAAEFDYRLVVTLRQ